MFQISSVFLIVSKIKISNPTNYRPIFNVFFKIIAKKQAKPNFFRSPFLLLCIVSIL